MDSQRQEFDIDLKLGDGNGYSFVVPFDVPQIYGSKGQVKVKVWIDGVEYRTSVAPIGGGKHYMVVPKPIREAIGKLDGGTIHVAMEPDNEVRTVDVPEDFAAAMSRLAGVRATFDKLSFTNQKEYVRWIEDAKKSETRTNRISKSVEMISKGKKVPR
jgi:hypothetical protein